MQEGLKLLFAKIWNELIYANVFDLWIINCNTKSLEHKSKKRKITSEFRRWVFKSPNREV